MIKWKKTFQEFNFLLKKLNFPSTDNVHEKPNSLLT